VKLPFWYAPLSRLVGVAPGAEGKGTRAMSFRR
jgi:hypothetical protein